MSPKTLKAFDKATGDLRWHHWLDNPVMSSDGYIYGYAYEQDESPEANSCNIVNLAGAGTPATLGIATGGAIRYKKWVRKISTDGAIIGDSDFFWYTGNAGYGDTPLELPDGLWLPDLLGATSDGELLQMSGDYSLGTTIGDKLISWDDNNTTTTRRYTFVAAALRDLDTVPTGGCKMRFVAADDGTNAEQTIDVTYMIGETAADIATALEAFPHIVSVTGAGGPYPFVNIDLEIEWAQDTTHFESVQRLSSTCRGCMTWLRDWDTAAITAVLAQGDPINSKADRWQLDESDNIIAVGSNPLTSIGSPAEVGIAVEKFTRSGSAFSQLWRVRPTSSNNAVYGGSRFSSSGSFAGKVFYDRPTIRGGRIIVGHDPGTAVITLTGIPYQDWNEINPADGDVIGGGTDNHARSVRPLFAADELLLHAGVDTTINDDPTSGYPWFVNQPENSHLTLSDLDGVRQYYGAYGPGITRGDADSTSIYTANNFEDSLGVPVGNYMRFDSLDHTVLTVTSVHGEGYTSRVSADSFFSLANYYRIHFLLASPANIRWKDTASMQWRIAFFNSADNLRIAESGWLDFDATAQDLQDTLDAIFGNNDDGPNSFVRGYANSIVAEQWPAVSESPLPLMVWQRGISLFFTAERANFPATSPPQPYGLLDRETVRICRVQVKSAVADDHYENDWRILRTDWATGAMVWDVPFGTSVAGGAEIAGNYGILLGENFVVSGNRVNGGCLSTWRWEAADYYADPDWVLIFADCGTKTTSPPATPGTYIGEVRDGTCVA